MDIRKVVDDTCAINRYKAARILARKVRVEMIGYFIGLTLVIHGMLWAFN